MTAPVATPSTAGHGLHRSFPPLPSTASLPADRRGRLRNGARPGDFLAAPRCGAHTRAGGCCRQPAMANGRCRLHGGLSTGPRTAEGRARCARARLKHGAYSAATRALMVEGRAHFRRVRALVGGRFSAGHGVLRSISPIAASGMSAARVNHRGHRAPREGSPETARAARNQSSSVSSVVKPSAGHGLLRSLSQSRPSARAARLLAGAAPLAPLSAGHGLLRPFPVAGQFRPNDGPAWPAGCRPDGSW